MAGEDWGQSIGPQIVSGNNAGSICFHIATRSRPGSRSHLIWMPSIAIIAALSVAWTSTPSGIRQQGLSARCSSSRSLSWKYWRAAADVVQQSCLGQAHRVGERLQRRGVVSGPSEQFGRGAFDLAQPFRVAVWHGISFVVSVGGVADVARRDDVDAM